MPKRLGIRSRRILSKWRRPFAAVSQQRWNRRCGVGRLTRRRNISGKTIPLPTMKIVFVAVLNGANFIIRNCPNRELERGEYPHDIIRKKESQFAVDALKTYGDSSLRYE